MGRRKTIMKKVLAVVLAAAMVFGCSVVATANPSDPYNPDPRIVYYSSSGTSVKAATVSVSAANAVQGTWAYDAATDTWTCKTADGKQMAAGWYLVATPDGKAQWFCFDANGKMLTGWVWVKDADGVTRCYYLNPVSDGSRGACYMNGRTTDGWTVNASGAWTVNGVVQTK